MKLVGALGLSFCTILGNNAIMYIDKSVFYSYHLSHCKTDNIINYL